MCFETTKIVFFCQKPAKSIFFYHIPLISDREHRENTQKQLGQAASGLAFMSFAHGKCSYSRLPNCKFGRTEKKDGPAATAGPSFKNQMYFYGFWVLVDVLHETDGGTFHASSIRIYSYIYISEKKIIRISFTISVQIDRCRPIHSKYIGLFVFPTI